MEEVSRDNFAGEEVEGVVEGCKREGLEEDEDEKEKVEEGFENKDEFGRGALARENVDREAVESECEGENEDVVANKVLEESAGLGEISLNKGVGMIVLAGGREGMGVGVGVGSDGGSRDLGCRSAINWVNHNSIMF